MPIAFVTFKDGLVNEVPFTEDNRRMFNKPSILTGRPDDINNYRVKLDRIDGSTGDFYFSEPLEGEIGYDVDDSTIK